jgi:putative AlgH/UPF0301 family transcriptional regulator
MIDKNYQGQLLVSNPRNPVDELASSVIFVLTHSEKMAVGLQINQRIDNLDLQTVAHGLGIWHDGSDPVYSGGNMGINKIHVVHTQDWMGINSSPVTSDLAVTNDISIIAAISQGDGPEYFRACAGFWLWEAGVLERQMNPQDTSVVHRWETLSPSIEALFEREENDQWRHCLELSARSQVDLWF